MLDKSFDRFSGLPATRLIASGSMPSLSEKAPTWNVVLMPAKEMLDFIFRISIKLTRINHSSNKDDLLILKIPGVFNNLLFY